MDRIEDRDEDLVELGIASEQTKGRPHGMTEPNGQILPGGGISDDD